MWRSSSTSRIARIAGWTLLAAASAVVAGAFTFITDSSGIYVVVWHSPTIPMKLMLPAPSSPLIDGTDYNSTIQAAMQSWNGVLGTVQFAPTVTGPGTYHNNNGVSEIVMDSKVDGTAFGSNVLAVTVSYTASDPDIRSESDIVVNTAYTWDSFRGGAVSGKQDLRRVVTHELGHVLGLDHPDQASPPQTVTAIMNSHISYSPAIDVLQTDDITGGQVMYGAPGVAQPNDNFANAIDIAPAAGTVHVTGSNIAATHQSGEPAHASSAGTKSVWWKWTAPSTGNVVVTTLGSDFDTVLGVYTGSVVNALTTIGSNDDVNPGKIRTSTVSFAAVSGVTYYFAVDGWDTYFGAITLNVTFDGVVAVTPPLFTSQPSSQTTTPGGLAGFTVTADGTGISYQWFLNGTAVAGATSAQLSLTNVQAANAGTYTVTATNTGGSVTSNPATLTVLSNPVANETATLGHDVAFSATGEGGNVQWQISTDGGTTWTNLSNDTTYTGVNTSTLDLTGATSALNGARFRLVSTTNGGSSTSNVAILSVAAVFFPMPVTLDLDSQGNLYVGDTGSDTIQKITPAGLVSSLAGSSGQSGSTDGTGEAARFNDPSGLAAAADGTLGVADTANATLRKVSAAGAVTTLAGTAGSAGTADGTSSAARFNGPIGVAEDASGTFYVADATNHTIRRITSGGSVTTLAGSAGASGTADGTGSAAHFNHPTGIAVDGAGNVYVDDTTNNTIRKVTSAGVVTTLAGVAGVSGSADGAGSAALFNHPGGLAVDGGGNIYLVDTGNSTIRKITPAGMVTTVAGLPGIAGLKDGTGNDAWFNQPQDLALDGSNNLYVADTGNANIRKVTLAGAVTTVSLASAPPTTTPVTPPTNPAPTPTSSGGGGAMGGEFFCVLSLMCFLRWRRRRN